MKNVLRKFFVVTVMLFGLAACAGTSNQKSAGEVIDDAAITTKVKSALIQDKDVSAMRIQVETYKGVVQLSGFANTREEADKAVDVTRRVAGVKSVKNDIRIK